MMEKPVQLSQMITLAAAFFLTTSAFASPRATTYACVAKVDCGAPALPSIQDLPSDKSLLVKSDSIESARSLCYAKHNDEYVNLAKTMDRLTPQALVTESRGCKILSEAFPIRSGEKRSPAAN